jgi:hypothetical protein
MLILKGTITPDRIEPISQQDYLNVLAMLAAWQVGGAFHEL